MKGTARNERKRRYENSAYFYVAAILLLVALIVVFPIGYTVYISLTNMNLYHWFDFEFIGIGNYIRAFSQANSEFLSSLGLTILWTIANMVLITLVSLVLAQDLYEMGDMARGLVQVLEEVEDAALTVLDASRLLPDGADTARCFHGSFEPRVEELFQEMVRRNNTYKTAKNEGKPLPTFGEQIYLITGLQLILDSLSDAGRDQLVTLLEKAEPEYGIRVVLCDSVKGWATASASSTP